MPMERFVDPRCVHSMQDAVDADQAYRESDSDVEATDDAAFDAAQDEMVAYVRERVFPEVFKELRVDDFTA